MALKKKKKTKSHLFHILLLHGVASIHERLDYLHLILSQRKKGRKIFQRCNPSNITSLSNTHYMIPFRD